MTGMIGQTFGKLTVVEALPGKAIGGGWWKCTCSCGATDVRASEKRLREGKKTSCGHLPQKGVAPTHGGSADREYNIWSFMRQRCNNPNRASYYRYGGRGIKVCERWNSSYEAFLEDMGRAPFDDAQIDRIDNDGDYEPGNCRWVSQAENKKNKSNARYLEHDGKRMQLTDWAKALGVPVRLLSVRLGRGWTDSETITGVKAEPPKPRDGTLWLTHDGETLTVKEWAVRLGVPPGRLHNRIYRGWTHSEIVTGVRMGE